MAGLFRALVATEWLTVASLARHAPQFVFLLRSDSRATDDERDRAYPPRIRLEGGKGGGWLRGNFLAFLVTSALAWAFIASTGQ
jgi:hypothetical protein